jgi:hypothetical protein
MKRVDFEYLKFMASLHEPYECLPTKDGNISFRDTSTRLGHSIFNPVREAQKVAASEGICKNSKPLILGIGLGYIIEESLRLQVGGLLAIEADPRLLSTLGYLLCGNDKFNMEFLLDSRVNLYHADDDSSLAEFLVERLFTIHDNRPLIISQLLPAAWKEFLPGFSELLADIKARRRSAKVMEEMLETNSLRNQNLISSASELNLWQGRWRHSDVLVCGAGPGLETDLDRIRRTRSEFRLIAVNTSYPALLKHGITADLVVAVDPTEMICADLQQSGAIDVPLLCFPGTNHQFVAGWPGPLVYAVPEGQGIMDHSWNGKSPGTLRSGFGTVAGPAIHAASLLSSGQILLSGIDLKINNHGMYADGVNRPENFREPNFVYCRRQLKKFVLELNTHGRIVDGLASRPDWMQQA